MNRWVGGREEEKLRCGKGKKRGKADNLMMAGKRRELKRMKGKSRLGKKREERGEK
jgi:hypothetical protein